jgi:hypothetical protein
MERSLFKNVALMMMTMIRLSIWPIKRLTRRETVHVSVSPSSRPQQSLLMLLASEAPVPKRTFL